MLDTGNGRVIFMASQAHEFASWDPEKMNTEEEQHYDRIRVYGVTKLYNVSVGYHRNWLLSACAYNTRQQENMRLTKSMRLTGSMRLIWSASTW